MNIDFFCFVLMELKGMSLEHESDRLISFLLVYGIEI